MYLALFWMKPIFMVFTSGGIVTFLNEYTLQEERKDTETRSKRTNVRGLQYDVARMRSTCGMQSFIPAFGTKLFNCFLIIIFDVFNVVFLASSLFNNVIFFQLAIERSFAYA
jgi:hypothetical protein